MNWKTKLPREDAKPGKEHFVLAIGQAKGKRMELAGELTQDQRERILKILMEK